MQAFYSGLGLILVATAVIRNCGVDSSLNTGVTLFPHPDDKFSLTELVDNYSSLFPVKVCVVKGFYGDRGENSAIAVDEMYNFHFVKRSKVRDH